MPSYLGSELIGLLTKGRVVGIEELYVVRWDWKGGGKGMAVCGNCCGSGAYSRKGACGGLLGMELRYRAWGGEGVGAMQAEGWAEVVPYMWVL